MLRMESILITRNERSVKCNYTVTTQPSLRAVFWRSNLPIYQSRLTS